MHLVHKTLVSLTKITRQPMTTDTQLPLPTSIVRHTYQLVPKPHMQHLRHLHKSNHMMKGYALFLILIISPSFGRYSKSWTQMNLDDLEDPRIKPSK